MEISSSITKLLVAACCGILVSAGRIQRRYESCLLSTCL